MKNQLAQPAHFPHKGSKLQGLSLSQGSSLACPKSCQLFLQPPRAILLTSGDGDLCMFISVTKIAGEQAL